MQAPVLLPSFETHRFRDAPQDEVGERFSGCCVDSSASEISHARPRQNNTAGKSAKPVQPFARKYSA
jgi:hypothetical protein